MKFPIRSVGRGAVLVVDQSLYSASNFLLAFVVLSRSTATDYGRFAIGLLTFRIVLAAVRAATSEVLLQDRHGLMWMRHARTACALYGVGATVLLLGGGIALGLPELSVFGVALPALLLQDNRRYEFALRGSASKALAMDAIWLAGLTVSVVVFPTSSGPEAILLWAAAGTAGLVIFSRNFRFAGLRISAEWMQMSRVHASNLAMGASLNQLGPYAAGLAVAWIAGVASLGRMQGAIMIFAPVAILYQALPMVLLPGLMSRMKEGAKPSPDGVALAVAGTCLTVPMALWIALETPAGWNHLATVFPALGGSRALLRAAALLSGVQALTAGASVALRVLQNSSALRRTRVIGVLTSFALAAAGAFWAAEIGALVGLVVAASVSSAYAWREMSMRTARVRHG